MKMVKSLLLGSAAGLVAVTAGQAADLPVKARPVQYVKVCSLYGAGFYYMPGTDMCIKIGGWVRAEVSWGVNGNFDRRARSAPTITTATPTTSGRGNAATSQPMLANRRLTAWRAAISRSALPRRIRATQCRPPRPTSNRAFVQWAGFTAGLSVSFFDFYPAAAQLYRAGNLPQEDTGDGGWWVWGYTAQFGGGFSATLSAEERRDSQNIDFSGAARRARRRDDARHQRRHRWQHWQQLMATAAGRRPTSSAICASTRPGAQRKSWAPCTRSMPATTAPLPATGHPGDAWGWVVGGGIKINTPFISPGDYFVGEVNYTQGATKYLWNSTNGGNVYNLSRR